MMALMDRRPVPGIRQEPRGAVPGWARGEPELPEWTPAHAEAALSVRREAEARRAAERSWMPLPRLRRLFR